MKKSWIEKRDCEKSFKIKTIDKKFVIYKPIINSGYPHTKKSKRECMWFFVCGMVGRFENGF